MLTAYAVAKESLPAYAHRFSPRKFTQHQLFACLVLKSMFDLDYRSIATLLHECAELRAVIDLREAPHFTTLQKAAARLLRHPHARRLHDQTIRTAEAQGVLRPVTQLAAVDASGFESHHTSRYFIRRRERGQKSLKNPLYQKTTYCTFPKASIVVDHAAHIILASTSTRGPGPDITQLDRLMVDTFVRRTVRAAALRKWGRENGDSSHFPERLNEPFRVGVEVGRSQPSFGQ